MRRRDFLKNSALVSAALALNPWLPPSPGLSIGAQVSDTSRTSIKKQAAYLVLEGPPKSRGRIHGEALRSQINALMEIWKDQLGRQYKVEPKQYIQKFLTDTKFPEAIRKWTPGLMEEVRGIAEGAAVDAEIRLMALEKRLKDPVKRITLEVIKEALSSKDDPRNPVCLERRPDGRGSFTAGCVIMELSEKPKLHFAPGPPCATEFQTYTFAEAL